MSMMEVGAGRERFATPAGNRDSTEFFDTLYCLTPRDLDRLPLASEQASAAAALLLAAAQEFVVNTIADLFPFWRQPVSDRVALAVLAFAAVGVQSGCAAQLPGRQRFDAINGGLEVICGFALDAARADHRGELAYLAQLFDGARRTGEADAPAALMRAALLELLIDDAHLPAHGLRIGLLVRSAVEHLQQKLIPVTAERLVACWPAGATDCDK